MLGGCCIRHLCYWLIWFLNVHVYVFRLGFANFFFLLVLSHFLFFAFFIHHLVIFLLSLCVYISLLAFSNLIFDQINSLLLFCKELLLDYLSCMFHFHLLVIVESFWALEAASYLMMRKKVLLTFSALVSWTYSRFAIKTRCMNEVRTVLNLALE